MVIVFLPLLSLYFILVCHVARETYQVLQSRVAPLARCRSQKQFFRSKMARLLNRFLSCHRLLSRPFKTGQILAGWNRADRSFIINLIPFMWRQFTNSAPLDRKEIKRRFSQFSPKWRSSAILWWSITASKIRLFMALSCCCGDDVKNIKDLDAISYTLGPF